MTHYTVPSFWQQYNALPQEIRELADKNYLLLKSDPRHASPALSVQFLKKLDKLWSVRVGSHYRISLGAAGRVVLVLDWSSCRVRSTHLRLRGSHGTKRGGYGGFPKAAQDYEKRLNGDLTWPLREGSMFFSERPTPNPLPKEKGFTSLPLWGGVASLSEPG